MKRPTKFAIGTTEKGKDFRFPISFTTETCGILARRGGGKTYTGHVMAEGLLGSGQQIVVVDPLDAWWGLRSGAAGRTPMFEVVIMGGEHGDLPLNRDMGVAIAQFVAQNPQLSCVLSLRHLRKNDQYHFVTQFAETFYHVKGKSKYATPVHVFVDEADRWIPQRTWHGSERMLGAMEDLVLRGRQAGIGMTVITQRSAKINKNVLTQVEILVVGQITGPQDKKAVGEWIELNAEVDKQKAFLASLAKLKRGNLWFWSPAWLQCMELVKVKKKLTFDSSFTPKPGARVKAPKKYAPVDLGKIEAALADALKAADENDPRKLKQRIAELEKQLKKAPTPVVNNRVEIDYKKIESEMKAKVAEAGNEVLAETRKAVETLEKKGLLPPVAVEHLDNFMISMAGRIDKSSLHAIAKNVLTTGTSTMVTPRPTRPHPPTSEIKLARCERSIMNVLALRRHPCSKRLVALQSGYSVKSGSFNNSLSRLRTAGLIESNGVGIVLTPAGNEQLPNVESEPLKDIDYWASNRNVGKCGGAILRALKEYGTLSKSRVAEITGYQASSGSFNNSISKLRGLELVEGRGELSLSTELFS